MRLPEFDFVCRIIAMTADIIAISAALSALVAKLAGWW